MSENWSDYVGHATSVFVILSFMLKDIKKIRIINLIGCVAFVVYGIFSGMLWPVIIPNAILCVIQVFHLIKKD